MFEKITQIFKIKDLRRKIYYVVGLLIVFRILAHIPIPGVDLQALRRFFQSNELLGFLDIFSGGGLSNLSLVMLGVGPYITASIIMQLLAMVVPAIEELQKEGERGRQKINQYTRLLTVPLTMLQSYSFLMLLVRSSGKGGGPAIISGLTPFSLITTIISVTAGTVFLMWIGELITEKGIGNGISLIIFSGIVARIPTIIKQIFALWDSAQIPTYLAFLAVAIVVIAGVVFVTEGQRNIPVSFAKRIRGHKMYGGTSTYLPLRVNQAGVIPIIFAVSIMLFPNMIAQLFTAAKTPWLAQAAQNLTMIFQNQWFYGVLYFVLVVAFTYFYTAVTFNPQTIAENVQKQGGFVPGIRPGKNTAQYLHRIMNRVTLAGAIFLGIIAVLPIVVQGVFHIANLTIGGTGLLIVVSVVLETMKQVESQLTMREYEGF